MSAPRTIYLVPARNVAPRPISSTTNTQRTVVPVHRNSTPILRQHYSTPTTIKRSSPVQDPVEEILNDCTSMGPPRKRERLNHLTPEEKLNRRKLKNRVAAQTARDRKKMRSQRLEDVVRQLLEENELLRQENSRLRAEKEAELQQPQQEQKPMRGRTLESAAFISGPQQRLIPQNELDRILEDLKEDFDIDQLASELSCDSNSSPEFAETGDNSQDVAPSTTVATASQPVEPRLLTVVPSSPSNSSSTSRPSPVHFDECWLEDKPLVDDPLLSATATYSSPDLIQDDGLWPLSSTSISDPFGNTSPFNDTFNEEFLQLY